MNICALWWHQQRTGAFEHPAGMIDTRPMSENIGEVAEVIYRAATDGTAELALPLLAMMLLNCRRQVQANGRCCIQSTC